MLQAVASGAAIRGIVWLDEQGVALLGFTVTVGATRNETDIMWQHLTSPACLVGVASCYACRPQLQSHAVVAAESALTRRCS